MRRRDAINLPPPQQVSGYDDEDEEEEEDEEQVQTVRSRMVGDEGEKEEEEEEGGQDSVHTQHVLININIDSMKVSVWYNRTNSRTHTRFPPLFSLYRLTGTTPPPTP